MIIRGKLVLVLPFGRYFGVGRPVDYFMLKLGLMRWLRSRLR